VEAGGKGSNQGSSGKVLLALDELTAGHEKAVGELVTQSIRRCCVGLGFVLTMEGAEEGANLGEGKAMGWRSTPESDEEESESPGRLGVGGGGYEPSGRCGRCVRAVGLPRLDSHVGTCCWTTTTARASFGF
jgi:hypothetical protein